MANRPYRHPIASRDDPTENVPNVLQDELDGSFSEVTRARLEGWDGSDWIKLSVTSAGALNTAGARINGCCIGFTELGGDGPADPALGATDILFR